MTRMPAVTVAVLLLSVSACGSPRHEPQQPATPVRSTSSFAGVASRALTEKHGTASAATSAREVTSEAAPVWSGVVLRLEFVLRDRGVLAAGTGFVIQDRAQDYYLLTCAHLIEDRQWHSRGSVAMRTMNGDRLIESWGPSLHIGTPIDLRKLGPNGRPDMTQDLVIRPLTGPCAQPLPLARADPAVGDWVWVVGCEYGKPLSNEKLFRGRITEVANGGYVMLKHDQFNPRGFSGGPLVNHKGEVVGNVLAGSASIVCGATVSTLRQRLREKGIFVD